MYLEQLYQLMTILRCTGETKPTNNYFRVYSEKLPTDNYYSDSRISCFRNDGKMKVSKVHWTCNYKWRVTWNYACVPFTDNYFRVYPEQLLKTPHQSRHKYLFIIYYLIIQSCMSWKRLVYIHYMLNWLSWKLEKSTYLVENKRLELIWLISPLLHIHEFQIK